MVDQAILMASALGTAGGEVDRWPAEKAWGWYHRQPWLVGCNFLPSTAVNDVEMWQAETFDAATIDRELGWAAAAAMNSCRVFLSYVVWKADADGFRQRLERFLAIADGHGITVMPVLFDDCAFAGKEPEAGPQAGPVPGVHNSGWVPSPGLERVADRAAWPDLERYVRGMVGTFADDRRVVVWDLYNEPGNSGMGERSRPLVEASFAWTRATRPSQPLTVGAWHDLGSPMSRRLMELSDVVSFHGYDAPAGVREKVALCQGTGRPLLCTEWLHRQGGNTMRGVLPIWAQHRIGCYQWGLVAGRTQTYMPWGSKPGDPVPALWQHDLLHADGRPFDGGEVEHLRAMTGKRGVEHL